MPLRVIAHPVYAGGLVVMSCGDGGGARYMIAVDPEKPKPAKVWELSRDVPYVPCVLVKSDPKAGDLLFWVNDPIAGGSAVCAEAKTGKALFNAQTTTKPSSSSPVMAGGEILTVADDGARRRAPAQIVQRQVPVERSRCDRLPLQQRYQTDAVDDVLLRRR